MRPLVAICTGYFMVILDATIVNTALPAIGEDLGAGVSTLQWVVSGYTLVFAALLLTGGAVGDRLGHRGVFEAGLALFTLASLAGGLAPSAEALVAARAIQGVGAALAVPTSLALLRATYERPAERARALGIWGGVAGLAAASGPVLGGLLTEAVGWRAVFLVNVPIGAAGLWPTARHVIRTTADRPPPAPPAGQLLGLTALAALTFALIEAGSLGWTAPAVLAGFALAAAASTGFVLTERRIAGPMLPRELFRDPSLAAGSAVGLLLNLGFYGQLFVFNLYLPQVRGLSPEIAGLALLPRAAGVGVASIAPGRLRARPGPRPAMLAGLATGAAGLFGLIVAGAETPYWLLVPPLVATGAGMAFTMPAATTAVVEAAPARLSGVAAGLINAARQAGGAIGVAVLGALVAGGGGFLPGLHASLAIAGGAFLAAAAITAVRCG